MIIALSGTAAQDVDASPDAVRRLLHFSIALAALSFPWLFASVWPVAALVGAALVASLLWCAPHGIELRSRQARRNACGALWFGCGLCLTFFLSAGEPVAYCIAILLPALADPAAARVGRRFGRAWYTLGGARKSAAGSLAFFATALAVVACGLVAGAGLRLGEALGGAALVATITTGLEASLADGLDNLFVPLGALAALEFAAL